MFERCILMTTDPGDLVLDPTCGSGTTAYVAEQWGRRWITIDTSASRSRSLVRALWARAIPTICSLTSPEGQIKEAEVTAIRPIAPTHGNIRQGFVYERVPHITLKSIANNAEIDVIWEEVAGNAGAAAREAERRAQARTGKSGKFRARPSENGPTQPRTLHAEWWEAAYRAPEGDRRLNRCQGRVRVPL